MPNVDIITDKVPDIEIDRSPSLESEPDSVELADLRLQKFHTAPVIEFLTVNAPAAVGAQATSVQLLGQDDSRKSVKILPAAFPVWVSTRPIDSLPANASTSLPFNVDALLIGGALTAPVVIDSPMALYATVFDNTGTSPVPVSMLIERYSQGS